MWDLIVSVLDHCLPFYIALPGAFFFGFSELVLTGEQFRTV